ncbi:YgcG family protein [Pseudoduganella plicata]|uniref:TPM domain-containing protein n=1 Tax=Pseudoduganella plicata TaxID=321984 RepID=UPI003530E306
MLSFALLVVEAAKAQGTKRADGFVPVPQLQSRVTDQVNLLTAEQRASLEAVLADYETKTGSQIAVLLMSSTAPEPIEQYSIRVTDAWKLGRKGVDDGVLLVVAKDNPSSLRRLRIEAGRGVQGVLTDAQSKRVLQDVIAPHFRNNDYYGGLTAGVGAIATLLDKEQFPAPAQQAPAPKQAEGGGFPLWPLLLFGVFVVLPMLRGGSRRRGLHRSGWGSDAAGVLIGSVIGSVLGGGGRSGSGSGGGFGGGGGGTFDGGGASGDW